MAKQPRFYPIIPRDKQTRRVRSNVDAILVTAPVRVPVRLIADQLYKPSNTYTPLFIDTNTYETYGTNVKSGVKNPSWRVTIAKGGDATSNYSRQVYHIKPLYYTAWSESSQYLSKGIGQRGGEMLIQQNDPTDLDNQAIGRLKNRLQGKVGNAQLGPPLAESREIGRLVRQINDIGMNTLKSLLAAKASKGKSVAKQFADAWLGFGFGVNPLLQDIKSAADSIAHYITRQDLRVVVRGTATREYHSSSNANSSSEYIVYSASLGFRSSAHHIQGIRYVAGVDLQVRGGSNYSVADHLGLKVEALPSILWELTPYSWVVDYFTTVGSWLEDAFYTVPGTVKYVSKNYKYQSVTTSSPVIFPLLGWKAQVTGGPAIARYVEFSRTQLAPVFPVRSLSIKSVDEIASHGLTKLLNLASVLAVRHGPRLDQPPSNQFREKVNPL